MQPKELVILLATGTVAGWLAGVVLKRGGFTLIGNIIVGVTGAFIGKWLFGLVGISFREPLIKALVTATAGSVILLLVAGLVTKKTQ